MSSIFFSKLLKLKTNKYLQIIYLCLFMSIFICLCKGTLCAQTVNWGSQPIGNQVAVDTVGGQLSAKWTNLYNNTIWSPPRFYHLWIEQRLPNGTWQIPAQNGHFFVSDTTWVADPTHLPPVGTPIRLRVAAFTNSTIQQRTSSNTHDVLLENTVDIKTSDEFEVLQTTYACCIISVVVDNLPTPGCNVASSMRLQNALTMPTNLGGVSVTNTSTALDLSDLASWLEQNHLGRKLSFEVKARTDCATQLSDAEPLLYSNAQTAAVIEVRTGQTLNQLNYQLPLLLESAYKRLNESYNASSRVDDFQVFFTIP